MEPYIPVRVHICLGGTNNKKRAVRRAVLFSFIGYIISLIMIYVYIYTHMHTGNKIPGDLELSE
jgi:hypothetical protein